MILQAEYNQEVPLDEYLQEGSDDVKQDHRKMV